MYIIYSVGLQLNQHQTTAQVHYNSPKFSERFLKCEPTLRKTLHSLAEVIESVVKLPTQFPLCVLCHQVIAIVHVLCASQCGHNLTHLCIELNVSMLLLADNDRTLGKRVK